MDDVSRTTSQTAPGQTTTSSSGGASGKGSSISNDTIGIIVGVVGIVVAIIGVYYTRKTWKERAEKKRGLLQEAAR